MRISIIIPTLNEALHLKPLLDLFQEECQKELHELIVVDGGSTDETLEIARKYNVRVIESEKGRAVQMNRAAAIAKGQLFYFVHADTLPPKSCLTEIWNSHLQGAKIGCYRFKFDQNNLLLKINSFFTRLPFMWCRGGDQSLFVERDLFRHLEGFSEAHKIMEDYDFIRRAKKENRFFVLPNQIKVSARKYQENSYFRVNLSNLFVYVLYQLGYAPNKLAVLYKKLLN